MIGSLMCRGVRRPGLALAIALGAAAAHEERYPELGLTLRLPELEELSAERPMDGYLHGRWGGSLRGSSVSLELYALPSDSYRLREAEDVGDFALGWFQERARRGAVYRLGSSALLPGEFGWVPYAQLLEGEWLEEGTTRVRSASLALCGLLEEHGYVLAATCEPPLEGEDAKYLRAAVLEALTYQGPQRHAEWTEEEVRARWRRDAPASEKDELEDVIRTEHYIVLSSSSGGKLFARKMEECYERIREIYPFDEVPGRKLMPVFLFRTPQEYHDFYVKVTGATLEEARRSKGHAWRDYYATWYEAPNDPVHVHEATHQIFANRLRLSGGGSWFQEGVAEYVETRANDRNGAARLVKKGRHTPLRELMQLPSLLHSSKADVRGGGGAGDHYEEAALLIEFLRESRFGEARFMDFVHAVGSLPRGDLEAIEGALRSIYGVGIDELDAELVEYCKRR